MKRCHWHLCNQRFEPTHARQIYCCPACRMNRLEWAKARGTRLVTAILGPPTTMLSRMKAERQRLISEIEAARRDRGGDG